MFGKRETSDVVKKAAELRDSYEKLLKDYVIALTESCDCFNAMDDDLCKVVMPIVNKSIRVMNQSMDLMEESAAVMSDIQISTRELDSKIDILDRTLKRNTEVMENILKEMKKKEK